MSSQSAKFEYDSNRNILFTDDDYDIVTEKDVDRFLSIYEHKLSEIGHKIWLVAHIDGLRIGAKVSGYYGDHVKILSDKWYLGFARWGTDPLARMTVRAASIHAKYDINIYNTKESAIAAIDAFGKKIL